MRRKLLWLAAISLFVPGAVLVLAVGGWGYVVGSLMVSPLVLLLVSGLGDHNPYRDMDGPWGNP